MDRSGTHDSNPPGLCPKDTQRDLSKKLDLSFLYHNIIQVRIFDWNINLTHRKPRSQNAGKNGGGGPSKPKNQPQPQP